MSGCQREPHPMQLAWEAYVQENLREPSLPTAHVYETLRLAFFAGWVAGSEHRKDRSAEEEGQ
jgi:hypothetical protein